MDELLSLADELGALIKDTSIYRNFKQASDMLAARPEASKLLDEYARLSGSLKQRQERGESIEKHETDGLESLLNMISGDGLIMQYLDAREEYMNLLVAIQNEIRDGDIR